MITSAYQQPRQQAISLRNNQMMGVFLKRTMVSWLQSMEHGIPDYQLLILHLHVRAFKYQQKPSII